MRIVFSLLTLFAWLLAAQACAPAQPGKQGGGEARSAGGREISATASVVEQFDAIPLAAVKQAAGQRVLFIHASTGGYVSRMGLNYLQGTVGRSDPEGASPYPVYQYDRRAWAWPEWRYDELQTPKTLLQRVVRKLTGTNSMSSIKLREFEADVREHQDEYDVIGMKLCYLDWKGLNWKQYRDGMERLEKQYPEKIFLWATIPLQYTWDAPASPAGAYRSITAFNDSIRAYAKSNAKPLFDVADIESHRADGTACTDSAGRAVLCQEYHLDELGHPNGEGSIRLAKGFWWLMAGLEMQRN